MHKVIKYLEIRYADPICTIELIDDALLYGTMLGRSGLYLIEENKFYLLTETEKEAISGCHFHQSKKNDFFVTVGDETTIHYNLSSEESVPRGVQSKNYASDSEHNSKCEGCFSLLARNCLLRLYLNLPPDRKDLGSSDFNNVMQPTEYIVKNLVNNGVDMGNVNMSSYCVPFDYDVKRLLWVDFLSKTERNIFIYNFTTKKMEFNKRLSPSFGHISHFFFLPNNRLFLIRNYNLCEIRNDKFEVLELFGHVGEECIASHYYYDSEKDITYIVTLDIGGNVNLYDDKSHQIYLLFNMYYLHDISQENKEKQFFSMDYPYFIRMTAKFFAITTDYGCYIIKRK